ncbi:MAG: TolC family protein [Gemmataceae bacterium]|nr:TolC family protein [Gemmataceae bacterium]MCI0738496.1 TolC family protein [Gemmataceae bacterium]
MHGRLLLVVAVLLCGCTRAHYRNSADRETYPIIAERQVLPAYDIGRMLLEPPPESRLYDPYNPDRPPKPPDDPVAAMYMARPGGMKGAHIWERDGLAGSIEPDGWKLALDLDKNGVLRLDQNKAVEIALLDSREYQDALDAVYLSALALTLNRYEFDLRWFLRNNTTFTHFGTGGLPTETNTLESVSNLGFTRSLAAGGQLVVDFANSLVYEYVGGTSQVSSNLAITLAQPLLRNFGRYVRLEDLTQAERNVLYAVRDFARFRKKFWADTAVQNGGYLDLLLALQTLRNNEANYKRQEETYRLYNELFRTGRASAVEFDQFFQSWQSAKLNVIDSEAALESASDSFKLRLGLPPRLPVTLDDALLSQFVLVDADTDKLRDRLNAFQRERLKELGQPPAVKELEGHFAALRKFADEIPHALDKAVGDVKKWGERVGRPARPGDDPEYRERERETYQRLLQQAKDIEADLKKIVDAIELHKKGITEKTRKEAWEALTQDTQNLLKQLDSVVTMQTEARAYLIELPEVSVAEAEALSFAKENRLDLQNQLGIVTDAWRKVKVAANALHADVNVIAEANLGTDPDGKNPLAFSAQASRYAVGLRFDGPLNRQAERNAYRASLIVYQKARRDYMELSDQVELQIRQDLRQLRRLRFGFEISRQQLLSAARQFESARLILLGGPREKRTANDTTTLNLLQALQSLLDARNRLVASYVQFEQQRIQLLLDLEALQLDQRGFPDASYRNGQLPIR